MWEDLTFLFKIIFKEIFRNFLRGVKDCVYGIYSIVQPKYKKTITDESKHTRNSSQHTPKRDASQRELALKKEKDYNIRAAVWKCSTYNIFFYGISVVLIETFLYLMSWISFLIFAEDTAVAVYYHVHLIVDSLMNILWMIPLFIIFKIVNVFWFQDIAAYAYKVNYGKPKTSSIADFISDNIFSVIIEIMFLVQIGFIGFIVPNRQLAFFFKCIQHSLLNSLYSFEYMWCNQGWTFQRRINYIEENWPYFLGFGFPLSICTLLAPWIFASSFLFSFFFPFYIISTFEAEPPEQDKSIPKFRVFALVMSLASLATNFLTTKEKKEEGKVAS